MLPINLALSLIFGAGQIVVGAALMRHAAKHNRWRRAWRSFGLALAGVWLITSGAVELFVSGMEAFMRLTGTPTQAFFTLWRGRGDTLLFAVSALLVVLALAWPLAQRLLAKRGEGHSAG